jgi:branched-chain amino acid transport system ATP-binding protein
MTPALVVEDLTKAFGALVAVRDVSLTVNAGERRAIIGTNGAGKTTLFNLIAGDFRPTRGSLAVFGQSIAHLPAHRRTRIGISRTYQTSRVLSGLSVLENLYLAVRGVEPYRFSIRLPRESDEQRVRSLQLAQRVGLEERVNRMASELSHGEQRQLEIGMALAARPRLLLLDEPAAGLGPADRALLQERIDSLPRDLTIVLVEHDIDLVLNTVDRVVCLSDGRVVADGTPQEIRDNPVVQEVYLGSAQGA